MKEVVIWLDNTYTKNKSIWVSGDLSKEEITKLVNEQFENWWSYDIW